MQKKVLIIAGIVTSVVVVVVLITVLCVVFLVIPKSESKDKLQPTCDSKVYCQGELLHTVQMARLNDDSKGFVDKSLLHDEETILENFKTLMKNTDDNPSQEELEKFVDENFLNETALEDWIPNDFIDEPPILADIEDDEIRNFTQIIIGKWKELGKKVKSDVSINPQKYSIIYVPNGFIIPGGRFREYYYWDSYWIVDGLLISGMTETVKGMIDNFLEIVNKYGHVPNGGRIYYIQRSQPPLLSFMAKRYYEETKDTNWLTSSIDALEKEVDFWIQNRIHSIEVDGKTYYVGTYNAKSAGPRPESYYEDVTTALYYKTEEEREQMYIELKSAAESGWDFTSRWIFDANGGREANLTFTKTTRVAPVDLNSFLYGAFDNVAKFFADLKNEEKHNYWKEKADELYKTINELLWNESDGTWYDYDLELRKHRKYYAASNLSPLWTKAYNLDKDAATSLINRVIAYLKNEGIMDYMGGIPTTTTNTGEQWDMPNAWPCLQSIIVGGLADSDVAEGKALAKEFAERWVKANMIGYNESSAMYEKYDSETPGAYGGGGEYQVQTGFGWTNGIFLEFVKKFYTKV